MKGYSEYLKLNKNILAGFGASLVVSAVIAQLLADTENYLNTTYTLAVDYAVYFTVFGVLFYIDNRRKYRLADGSVDGSRIRHDLVRLVGSLGIGEIVYTAARWLLQYYFLEIEYDPYIASVTSQVISTAIFMVTVNVSVKLTKLYKNE